MSTKVKVWVEADEIIKASDVNRKTINKSLMEEVPKGEKSK